METNNVEYLNILSPANFSVLSANTIHPHTAVMKKTCILSIAIYLLIIFCSTGLQSCSKYTVTTSYRNTSDIIYKKRIATSYLWGILNKPSTIIDTTCSKCGLSEVKITSGIGYSIINVVTLGIVHIVKIETKCQKDLPLIGEQP
jgi:hypothetical protein